MDLDLFGAFEGEEKASDVREAKDGKVVNVKAGKRKVAIEIPVDGNNKRQALPSMEGGGAVSGRHSERAPIETADSDRPVTLVEGEESSTKREDGTLVKSVRIPRGFHQNERLELWLQQPVRL